MLRNLILVWLFFTALLLISKNVYPDTILFVGGEYTTTNESIKVAWDASEGAEFYEIKLAWIDVDPEIEYNLGRTMTLEYNINFPRSGHFKVYVRAGAWKESLQREIFSVWIDSTDAVYSTVNGEPMGWRINKKIGAPIW